MLALVSPAKKMDFEDITRPLSHSDPDFFTDTKKLVKSARQLSQTELQQLMNLSDSLSELNFQRFKAFKATQSQANAKQAAMAFAGDTYIGLDSATLSDNDFDYAQDHLRILSGLYGLLRPLDLIQPYRLEMGTKMANGRGKSLYDFWGARIADRLNADLADHADTTVVNLASNEYFKAVDAKALGQTVIGAKFLNVKDGKARSLMYYAKHARGAMARWIMENRVDRADGLKDFNADGYTFDASASTDNALVFSRPQPPKKG